MGVLQQPRAIPVPRRRPRSSLTSTLWELTLPRAALINGSVIRYDCVAAAHRKLGNAVRHAQAAR